MSEAYTWRVILYLFALLAMFVVTEDSTQRASYLAALLVIAALGRKEPA